MRISYNWLKDYIYGSPGLLDAPPNLVTTLQPDRLSHILTSIGLEVEHLDKYEEFEGGLEGLVVGEIIDCTKHPYADKLSLTNVDIGDDQILQIICGAPNVAVGQKVVVAPVGTTIHPQEGGPVKMKLAKIRGLESHGMICAEDEIGIGNSHEGIIILPCETIKGMPFKEIQKPYSDWVYQIGLTANRMDAMSHIGVARDVCAWLSHHDKQPISVTFPFTKNFMPSANTLPLRVTIENTLACQRYSGVSISGVKVKDSPRWLKDRLRSIGLRPLNNIVDVTNFVLHEFGQPLHAFDLEKIKGQWIIVRNLPLNTPFVTLDEKERKLDTEDLMICDGENVPMCFGGVFGGMNSGVSDATKHIFLESAWFDPSTTRRTSIRHGLRTDAAIRFEKGVDISATIIALKRAALLICELAGGEIASEVVDIYPEPHSPKELTLSYNYLRKISGKIYQPNTVIKILKSLGFDLVREGVDDLVIAVPFNKPDVTDPADIIEEIMRIDGYDNIDIPAAITITPSPDPNVFQNNQAERTANYLVGVGFSEIFTNSITNSQYYPENGLISAVRIVNSLSKELDIMRPSLLETGLERISYNINRKNIDLQLFEFGKVYSNSTGKYLEINQLALFSTGHKSAKGWQQQSLQSDLYFIKGICEQLFKFTGLEGVTFKADIEPGVVLGYLDSDPIVSIRMVNEEKLLKFSIKQPVLFAEILWDSIIKYSKKNQIIYGEIGKFPMVQRDLSLVVNNNIRYTQVEAITYSAGIKTLKAMTLFDVFVSEKLGVGKKSLAINFTFSDPEKTLTDREIDAMINKLSELYEKELNAEIRKA